VFLRHLIDWRIYRYGSLASGHSLEYTFGLQVQPSGKPDPFIGAAKEAVQALCSAALYGSYLVDYLPSREYRVEFLSLD
jgi:hypothetical protein